MKIARILSLCCLVIVVTSCGEDEDKARIVVRLTDSPGDYEAVNVDIQDIQVNSNSNGEDGWKSLANVNKGIYNLLELTNGTETVLTSAEYPTGKIGQIRLVLGSNNSVTIDGASYTLETPSSQQSGLKLLLNADLTNGITYAILLDFDAALSIVKTGSGKYVLKPVIKVVSEALDGAIAGKVLPAELNVAVFAISGTDTVSTSYVPAGSSDFFLGGLATGSYSVSFDPGELSNYQGKILENTSVTVGSITQAGTVELQPE
ncbi:MAG TPA: DUF4382 domain-containing protein [Chryseolinea sp.]|nr:DUF4382 domain-containing protein [Chryseolinea sp.]